MRPSTHQTHLNPDLTPTTLSDMSHLADPDADELHTHSQTQPYLRNEPTARVISGFFHHVFLQDITENQANLDLSDLTYNPSQPRQAEVLEGELNRCIDASSRSKFISSFVRFYTSMLVKTSFSPSLHTRRRPASIVTVVWI
jgi:hypothetical protein